MVQSVAAFKKAAVMSSCYAYSSVHDSKYSNLERISELKIKQEKQISNLMKDSQDEKVLLYDSCVEAQQEKLQKLDIFGPFYLFHVEGVNLSLSCSPCLPKDYQVSWTKLTFENFQTEVKKTDGLKNPDLTLQSPIADLSTYYCSWIYNRIEILMNIWTVEIVSVSKLGKVPARKWITSRAILGEGMSVQPQLEKWSNCNKCGTAGKRHRYEYCSVTIDNEVTTSTEEWQALKTYNSLSCSLFLNLHPEIGGINQELTQTLSSQPKIIIGYCKIPCDEYIVDTDLEQEFIQTFPESLRNVYRKGEGDVLPDSSAEDYPETNNNNKASLRNLTLKGFFKGLTDIPITTEYIPEILAILSLIFLQLFILYQICQNRNKAK